MPDSRATRLAAAAFALLLAGCPGGPDPLQPTEIDLTEARRLESAGKPIDALVEYARLVDELRKSSRGDVRAHAAWARILESLRRLKVGEALAKAPRETRERCASLVAWCSPAGPAFLGAGAAGHWNQVLSLGAEPALLGEAAAGIGGLLAEKLDDRSLRRGRLEPEGDVSERLYRRFLAEAAADYLRYSLSRVPPKDPQDFERAVTCLQRLARELRQLAELPWVRKGPAARWVERAAEADSLALALKFGSPAALAMSTDLRQSIELDTNGLFRAADQFHTKANDFLSRRAGEDEILDLLERCLRMFVTARECLVEPSQLQKRTLDVMPMAADTLRGIAFEK
ncbi:MAG TPA: hypothetical protein VJU16_00045 [Planctomycetota bacterium]|nr:hypothetical protein [Planctomycetota bacterium]